MSTTISGVPEIVDANVDGILVDPDSPPALAGAIEAILKDPSYAKELTKRGREKAEKKFDVRRNAAVLEEHFRNAVVHSEAVKENDSSSSKSVGRRGNTLSIV